MKKISLFFLLTFFSIAVFSQEAQFGIKGGLNISNTTNNFTGGTSSRAGIHAGLFSHIHLSPELAIQPEILFSSQGGKYTAGGYEHQMILNYINIPILFQYMFQGGFRIETGPQIGFLVDVKDKVGGLETGDITSSDFKSVDFSWAFGLGYLSNSGLGIDGRYNLGISNINSVSTATIHNSVIQIGLFYQFNRYTTTRRTYIRRRH